jgi:hypothetical protein
MNDFAPRTTLSRAGSLLGGVAVLLLAGCAASPGAEAKAASTGKTPMTQEEMVRRLEGFMAREQGPFDHFEVSFFGGQVTGTVESASKPTVECDGGNCVMMLDLGKDADGDASNIACTVSTALSPFGPAVLAVVGEATLTETPRLTTRESGQGLAATFVANAQLVTDDNLMVATPKVGVLYARGFMARCHDVQAGGRKTFDRVVGGLFDSMEIEEKGEDAPAGVFAVGYQRREGDRPTGFRFSFITRRGEKEPGHQELTASFALETEGTNWRLHDALGVVSRDETGAVEDMSRLAWVHGKGPLRLSAKPAEGKKMRLKFEAGSHVNALELTPRAPTNTEIWAAPELLAVSTGRSGSYTYSIPALDERDPSLHTLTLKRTAPGVLVEVEDDGSKKKAKAAPEEGDEIHVDERGLVTK